LRAEVLSRIGRRAANWSRRRHLDDILQDRQAELLLPVPQAVVLAFVLTSHETWEALVTESGLSQPAALELVTTTLDTALFGHRPGSTGRSS
jgi:hypothetical protein